MVFGGSNESRVGTATLLIGALFGRTVGLFEAMGRHGWVLRVQRAAPVGLLVPLAGDRVLTRHSVRQRGAAWAERNVPRSEPSQVVLSKSVIDTDRAVDSLMLQT